MTSDTRIRNVKTALPATTSGCRARRDRRIGVGTRSGSSASRGLRGVIGRKLDTPGAGFGRAVSVPLDDDVFCVVRPATGGIGGTSPSERVACPFCGGFKLTMIPLLFYPPPLRSAQSLAAAPIHDKHL
jgi:hypothetical protein